MGLGEKKSSALFYENWDVNRGGASFLKQSDEIGTEVEIDTIDNLLSEQKIDMVKIDVEGFELNVLKVGINVLKKNHPIFIIEVYVQEILSYIEITNRQWFFNSFYYIYINLYKILLFIIYCVLRVFYVFFL